MKTKYLQNQRGALDMIVVAVLFVLAIGVGIYLKFFSHAGGVGDTSKSFATIQAESLKYGVNGSGQYSSSTLGVTRVKDSSASNGGAVKIINNNTAVGTGTKATLAGASYNTHVVTQALVRIRTKTCPTNSPIGLTFKLYPSKHPDAGTVNAEYKAYATGGYFDQVYGVNNLRANVNEPLTLELIAGVPAAVNGCVPAIFIDKITFSGASFCASPVGLIPSAYAAGTASAAPGSDCSAGEPSKPRLKSATLSTDLTKNYITVKWDRPSDYHKVEGYRFYKNGTLVGTFSDEGYGQTSTAVMGGFAPGDVIQMKTVSFAGAFSKASNGVKVK